MSDYSIVSPPTVEQQIALAEQGFHHYIALPKICPCPMHDSKPEQAIIDFGSVAIRCGNSILPSLSSGLDKGETDWHSRCMQQNARHALTGEESFGDEPVSKERCKIALNSPWQMGSYHLPKGLDPSTKCAITCQSLFGYEDCHESYAGDQKKKILANFMGAKEEAAFDTKDCGWLMFEDGQSFFARHGEDGSVTAFRADFSTAAKALQWRPNLPKRNRHPDWPISSVDEETPLVLDLWHPYGPKYHFDGTAALTSVTDWFRRSTAWGDMLLGYPVEDVVEGMVGLELVEPRYRRVARMEGKQTTEESMYESIKDVVSLFAPEAQSGSSAAV